MSVLNTAEHRQESDEVDLVEIGKVMASRTTGKNYLNSRSWVSYVVFLLLALSFLLIIILFGLVLHKGCSITAFSSEMSNFYKQMNQSQMELSSLSAEQRNMQKDLNQTQINNYAALGRLSSEQRNVQKLLNQTQINNHAELARLSSELKNVQKDLNQTKISKHVELFPCGSRSREWEYFDGRCYFFSIYKVAWEKAETQCQNWNSQLVVIHDTAEQNFIQSRTRNERYWIGLTDVDVEGQWRWVDGTNYRTGFKNWMKGEPNDAERREDCAQVHISGEWNDMPCNHEALYMCVKPLPS